MSDFDPTGGYGREQWNWMMRSLTAVALAELAIKQLKIKFGDDWFSETVERGEQAVHRVSVRKFQAAAAEIGIDVSIGIAHAALKAERCRISIAK